MFKRRKSTVGMLIRSISEAVESVSTSLYKMREDHFFEFFAKNDDGEYEPKKTIIDRGDRKESFSDISMFHTSVPTPDQIKIKTSVSINDLSPALKKEFRNKKDMVVSDTSISMCKVKGSTKCDIEITFKIKDEPEGLSRVKDFVSG